MRLTSISIQNLSFRWANTGHIQFSFIAIFQDTNGFILYNISGVSSVIINCNNLHIRSNGNFQKINWIKKINRPYLSSFLWSRQRTFENNKHLWLLLLLLFSFLFTSLFVYLNMCLCVVGFGGWWEGSCF